MAIRARTSAHRLGSAAPSDRESRRLPGGWRRGERGSEAYRRGTRWATRTGALNPGLSLLALMTGLLAHFLQGLQGPVDLHLDLGDARELNGRFTLELLHLADYGVQRRGVIHGARRRLISYDGSERELRVLVTPILHPPALTEPSLSPPPARESGKLPEGPCSPDHG